MHFTGGAEMLVVGNHVHLSNPSWVLPEDWKTFRLLRRVLLFKILTPSIDIAPIESNETSE
jgi:hypothetical protein